MHAPTPSPPRRPSRRHPPAGAALLALLAPLGLLAAGCAGDREPPGTAGPESQEVHLQPVAAPGPDPFTASTSLGESAAARPPATTPAGRGIRTVGAATPGLYGGTRSLGSCDVEQQLRHLTADKAKARAFAEASGVEPAKLPEFLRGLTPVVLRADTRVTGHGFREDRARGFQTVLQSGTAVLVDNHGMPRVRCACGNPLAAPRAARGAPVQKGEAWDGYQAHQVVVVEPTAQAVDRLVIVDSADGTWIERRTGDAGAHDRNPLVPPPYDPADGVPDVPAAPPGTSPDDPCATADGAPGTAPGCPPDQATPPSPPGKPGGTGPAVPPVPRPPSGLPDTPHPDAPLEPAPETFPPLPHVPEEPGADQAPDGPAPHPYDPYGPYDPFAVPDQQPPDGGHSLESA
ncbi:DUF6777 domain-containing protein [Streptomyces sp. NPDC051567]|uniref:DUF6777 domain-containing protein n=1 Tax=Streptomyces sp. NPDC051567 TaxID=3365660 RepID=UPI0037B1087A